VEVIARDYSFDPSGIVVDGAGGPLELTLDNQGSVAHNLKVFDGATELGGTPTFQGGETRGATLELEPGSYRMVCTVANHEELGMVGDIEVR
jgi:plastocyanin